MDKKTAAGIALASASLVAFVTTWEGNETTTYKDIVGIPTVCAGITDPSIAKLGAVYTEEQCREINRREIEAHGQRAIECVNVKLSQGEYEAYASLAYNIGTRNFCSSTLVKKLNAEERRPACDQILRWNRAAGQVVRGLDNRRKSEHAICIKALDTGERAIG